MRNNYETISSFFTLLISAMGLFGCAPIAPPITPTKTATRPLPPTTILPTLTSTPTLHPTKTTTLTPPVTLAPEEAKATIKAFLQEPMDCAAPCFWDIIPEQTTLGEVVNIFTRLGLQINSTTQNKKRVYGVTYSSDSGFTSRVTVTIQSDVVQNLQVKLHPEKQQLGLQQEWSAYSPETLINRYGVPSKINFNVDRGEIPSYGMVLFFDANDLIVEYYSYDLGPKLEVCPRIDQMASVWLWMGQDPQFPPLEDVPLEEATSMTIEEFSKLMLGNPQKACFNLNSEAFP